MRARDGIATYAELESRALSVAAGLIGQRADAAGPVALLLEPSEHLFAAMLGSLAAGRFYVPLDPRLPDARLASIAGDLDGAVIVTSSDSVGRARELAPAGAPVVDIEDLVSGQATASHLPEVSPDDLAYVLFTSGSTGAPKGVMQSHRNLLHNTWKLASGLGIVAGDRISLLSSPSFGASVSDIFGALLTGAAVCPHDLAGDGLKALPGFLERERVTIYHSVPSVFRTFASTLDGREDLSAIRVVKLGGEAVLAPDFDLFRNRFPRRAVFHVGLGATEMAVIRQWSARHDTPWPGGTPLGYAVDGAEVVLLDETGAAGDEGEVAVVSSTLAVGYWKDPQLTASKLVPVPGRPGVRMFRTGDYGRMRPDGLLLHLGRRDARLKVRGHRVETAEVESALLAVPGVAEAAVDGRERSSRVHLTAWVVGGPPGTPGVGVLRRALSRRLPASMIPTSFVFLDALPRTGSGKVDRRALPEAGSARPALEAVFREPRNDPERAAAAAFALVLGLDRVGADDDFFELGGDSLSAVDLLASLSESLGTDLSAADLVSAPTPAGLAVRAGGARPTGSLVRLSEGSGRPVFVFPGGAGDGEDLFAARRLARLTRSASPFLAVRSGRPPHPRVEELAGRCVAEIRSAWPGPYALVGDCMGGILAFATALRLRDEGEAVDLLALLDTPFPTSGRRLRTWMRGRVPLVDRVWRRAAYFAERARHHAGFARSLKRGRWDYLRRMALTGGRGLAPPSDARRRQFLERRASYVGTLVAWKPKRFDGIVHVVECEESRRRGYGAAWSRLADASRSVVVAGDHEGFVLESGEDVGKALAGWLAGAGGAGAPHFSSNLRRFSSKT